MTLLQTARQALNRYGITDPTIEPLGSGLINETFLVTLPSNEHFVLQRLNRLFQPEINRDIDLLTRSFAAAGYVTQQLVATPDDAADLWVELDTHCWRLSTFVAGECRERIATPAEARAAGELLGRFHRQAAAAEIQLHSQRLGVHDTAAHLANLRKALPLHAGHRYFPAVNALADEVFAAAAAMPELPELPDRLVHGDPKISNLVFDSTTGQGLCMIDLDTLAYMPLPLELGDAFRSWCNPKGENFSAAFFRLDYFEAALEGYAAVAADLITPAEWQSFLPATRRIMVELAARFTLDALNESYFGWDPEQYADRSTHNQVRAAGQLALQQSLLEQLPSAEAAVQRIFVG